MSKPSKSRDVTTASARVAAVATLVIATNPISATEFDFAGGKLTVKGSVFAGTVIRTNDPDPELLLPANAALVGAAGSAVAGKNQDDGNLNFKRNEAVSTTAKGYLNLDYKHGDSGVVVSAKAWHDFELGRGSRPWGNVPNDFATGQPLSDKGALPRSKFSGMVMNDLYVYSRVRLGDSTLNVKAGNQRIDWGNRFNIGGGLGDLTPRDLPGSRRAGALPEEGSIPIPALMLQLSPAAETKLDAFYQVRFRRSAPHQCGTFFSPLDAIPEGCDKAFLASAASDRASLASGTFIKRAQMVSPSNRGQAGVGIRQTVSSLGVEIGVYFARFHSRTTYYSIIKGSRAGAPFIPNDPGGRNLKYFTEFPENIRVIGLTFEKRLPAGAIYGEFTYRPNQPYQYTPADLNAAFASPTASTPFRAIANAVAPGAVFHGFERHRAQQINLGAVHALPGILGSQSANIGGEFAYKRVPDLPDVAITRFRRPNVYGPGPVNGICPPGAGPKQCSTKGFVSRVAVAYRLRAGLRYPQIANGIDFIPALIFGHDLAGWSEDGAISEGRQFASVSLKAEIRKSFVVELAWQPTWGGEYNNIKDRSATALSVGYRF